MGSEGAKELPEAEKPVWVEPNQSTAPEFVHPTHTPLVTHILPEALNFIYHP